MPRISAFHGITVWMHYDEGVHVLPHFHARHAGHAASFTVEGRLLARELPGRSAQLVREWAVLHHDELLRNWQRARRGEPLVAVAPLP
jgi:hypothetical protein